MGRLARRPQEEIPQAGELLDLEALDRNGVAVRSDGALVRYLRVSPKNPLVMSESEQAHASAAFGALLGRLGAGQSLQFYVEATPVKLDTLLEQSRAEAEQAAAAQQRAGGEGPERARALRALQAAAEESLTVHAQDQAAVDLGCYLICPYRPPTAGAGLDWRELLPGRRGPRARSLERALSGHCQAVRESLRHTDALRTDLEALDLATSLLSGPEVADLLWRRFNPTTADRSPERAPSAGARLQVLGELDGAADAREAARAALRLRELIAASAWDVEQKRYVRVDRDLEQALYVGTTPDATYFGWLLGALQVPRPFTLSVHVHALDRLRERGRHKARHRRLFGINRGAEARGRVVDHEMLLQEQEVGELLAELSGQERAAVYDVSIIQSIRERGPEPDPVALAEAVDEAARELSGASDARVHRGEFLQEALWRSSLPLGRDQARMTKKYVTRHVGDTVPLIGTSCGSPSGVPFCFAEPGRTVELLDPWDPAHDNFSMLVNGKSGSGKTLAVNVIVARLLAHGARGYVLDRAGHYAFLCELIPGAQHVAIGASEDDHAVNPWDTPEPGAVPIEKVTYLVGLHALLVGDHRAGDDSYGISALERNTLEVAIRAVYARGARESMVPRESMLREELKARAEAERESGAVELAQTCRTLAERLASFCGEGSYAYLLDRETTISTDAPLVAFDTRQVPRELAAAVMFVLAEHVSAQIERQRERQLRAGAPTGSFLGKSFLVIDEAWKLVERRATGEWVNDLARRARHLGLFLVAISQQLSDFAGEYGKALIRNSTQQLFLRQSADELAYVQDALRLSPQEVRAIARLKTVKRRMSQGYWINGTRGRGTIALRLGPTEYWLATSDPTRDVPERAAALRGAGGDAWQALEALAKEGLDEDGH